MGIIDWVKGENSVMSSRQTSVMADDETQSLLAEGLGSLTGESFLEHPEDEEHRYIQRRIRDNPMWTLDRGTGFYVQERLTKKKASLLGSGKDAGKSMVAYEGIEWTRMLGHVWKKDFFTTAVHARFSYIVVTMIGVFISSFTFWAVIYYVIWHWEPKCFLGFHSFLSAFLFSIETQNTIGYGSHAIGDCWLPAWLVGIQCILAVLLEAIFLGIIFAKISHPKGRSRTIIISECACIARRDGILKLMFRVADIRKRTAIAPKIVAHLYTWGPGHTTAEGEHIPVQVQDLPLHFQDETLLLPVVVEHTIDERSPLYGHTSQSLVALGGEIVVTFEGHSELGDAFMTRRSYLPNEIHWGCKFVNIIGQAAPGSMQHHVDLSRFHEVEPQEGLAMMPPNRLSHAVVRGGSRRIPRPRLGENTLQLADELMVTQSPDGAWFVAVRVGDAYPSQMCNARVQMFIYRYNLPASPLPQRQQHPGPKPAAAAAAAAGGSSQQQQQAHQAQANAAAGAVPGAFAAAGATHTYVHQELALTRHLWRVDPAVEAGLMAGFKQDHHHTQQQQQGTDEQQQQLQQQGSDPLAAMRVSAAVRAAAAASAASHAGGGVNVLLRYPVVVGHEITADSPLKDWITHDGMLKDADAEIVVITSATMYCSSRLAMRSKVYSVLGSIRWGCSYGSCVVPPSISPTGHALVDWERFHDVVPLHASARDKHGHIIGNSSRPRHPGYTNSSSSTPHDSLSRLPGGSHPRGGQGGVGSAAWFDSSMDAGASWGTAASSSRQQQQTGAGNIAAQDAFETQMEDLHMESFTGGQLPQHQQQQQSILAAGSSSRRTSSAPLSDVVVHSGAAAAVTQSSDSSITGAASIPLAVALRQKQKLQQQQHLGSGPGHAVAHSLGFDHFHDVAQMQARLQQQQQQQQLQQQQQQWQQQWQRRLGGSASFTSGVRQGVTSGLQLHEAAAAAVAAAAAAGGGGEYPCSGGGPGGGSSGVAAAAAMAAVEASIWTRRRSSTGASSAGYSDSDAELYSAPGVHGAGERGLAGGSEPSSEAAVRHAMGGGGWGRERESSYTFKSGSHKSEESGPNRSLAAVMDLFQIAEQELQADAADAGVPAAGGAATPAAAAAAGEEPQQQQPHQQQQEEEGPEP